MCNIATWTRNKAFYIMLYIIASSKISLIGSPAPLNCVLHIKCNLSVVILLFVQNFYFYRENKTIWHWKLVMCAWSGHGVSLCVCILSMWMCVWIYLAIITKNTHKLANHPNLTKPPFGHLCTEPFRICSQNIVFHWNIVFPPISYFSITNVLWVKANSIERYNFASGKSIVIIIILI